MKGHCSLRRCERLRGHLGFEIVKRKGQPLKGAWLIVNTCPNNLTFNRIGISISSRIIHKSTKRNRAKRLIREAYRSHKKELKGGFDIVVRIRSPIEKSLSFGSLEKDLLDIFKKGRILA